MMLEKHHHCWKENQCQDKWKSVEGTKKLMMLVQTASKVFISGQLTSNGTRLLKESQEVIKRNLFCCLFSLAIKVEATWVRMQLWKKRHLCGKALCAEGDYCDDRQKWRQKGLGQNHLGMSKSKLVFKGTKKEEWMLMDHAGTRSP